MYIYVYIYIYTYLIGHTPNMYIYIYIHTHTHVHIVHIDSTHYIHNHMMPHQESRFCSAVSFIGSKANELISLCPNRAQRDGRPCGVLLGVASICGGMSRRPGRSNLGHLFWLPKQARGQCGSKLEAPQNQQMDLFCDLICRQFLLFSPANCLSQASENSRKDAICLLRRGQGVGGS